MAKYKYWLIAFTLSVSVLTASYQDCNQNVTPYSYGYVELY